MGKIKKSSVFQDREDAVCCDWESEAHRYEAMTIELKKKVAELEKERARLIVQNNKAVDRFNNLCKVYNIILHEYLNLPAEDKELCSDC